MFINVLILLPSPFLTIYLIDFVLPNKKLILLFIICSAAIIILFVHSILGYYQQIFFLKFNEKVIFDIQKDLFEKIQTFSSKYRSTLQTGYLMSRLKDDPSSLRSLFADTILSMCKDVLAFCSGLVIIFVIHWKLALLALLLLPFLIYSLYIFSHKIRRLSTIYYESNALVSKKMQESISLLDTFKLFNALKYDEIKLLRFMSNAIRNYIRKSITGNLSSIITGIITGIGPILIIGYGIFEIIQGNLTLGKLIAFNSFIGYLFGPAKRLMNLNINIQQSFSAWCRIYDLLIKDVPYTKNESYNSLKKINGNISFKNVSFSYGDGNVLFDINLEIKEKTIVGIVGESGSGKSTLVRLIPLFFDNYSGKIMIDGINLLKYDPKSIRRQIAIVDQEPVLFHDSILNNIRIGNRSASEVDIMNAAKLAHIHEYINSLACGYKTLLDERGLNMSIGQKQRIAIARAILINPSILILDEPTSNLDLESEKLILSTLNNFIKGRTTIIVAHRLSTLNFADTIVFLKNGRIVEIGTHHDLISKAAGYYKNYWNIQKNNNEV